MKPLISIIIPVYNHAATLRQSLRSLARQTYRPLQVILVDDGSTDDLSRTLAALDKETWYQELEVQVIHQANQGAPVARNRGFEEAQGEWVIFWDADTVAKPRMLEKMAAVLLVHTEASYVYSQFRFGWKKMKGQVFNADDLEQYNYIDTTSLLRRKDFPGFDPALKRFQDWDLWLTLLKKNKTGIFLPEVLYRKIVGWRRGYSAWLPSFMYRFSENKTVAAYNEARKIIWQKHGL